MGETQDLGFELRVEERAGYLEIRVSGAYSRETAFAVIDRIERETRDRPAARVLLDITALSGSAPDFDRFEYAVHAARVLGGLERFAVLASASFGVNYMFEDAARNRGLPVRVFLEPGEALAWLRGPGR